MSFRSNQPGNQPVPNLAGLVLLTGIMGWATMQFGPVTANGEVQLLPAMTGFIAALGALNIVSTLLNLLARLLDWHSSHTASGKDGTARWGTAKDLDDET